VLIDCDGCAVRDLACGDCVVTVLLGAPPGGVEVDEGEQRALSVLADSGLVPRLRLVPIGLPATTVDPTGSGPPGAGGDRSVLTARPLVIARRDRETGPVPDRSGCGRRPGARSARRRPERGRPAPRARDP
jgi:hypothetical protein